MNFELTLLNHLISDKVFFNRAKTVLKKSIFSNIANGTIYDIMEKHYNKYKEVPTIPEIILEARELPNAELKKQIAQSLTEIPKAEKINEKFLDDYTVRYAKNQLFEQALIEGAEFIDKHSDTAKEKARALIEESQKLSMVDDLGDLYSDFEPRFEYYQNPEKGFKYLRFKQLNEFLGEGILPGTLNLFLAPPGIGKSMMISYTIGDFLLQKKNVLLVSMEMSNYEFMKRIDADLLKICIRDLGKAEFSLQMREKFISLKSNIGELYVQNYPPNSFSAYTLESLLEMYKTNDIKIDMVFLDYLGLMKSDLVSPNVGLYSHIKSIGEEVRAVAKLWNIPTFSASQLNRCFSINTLVRTPEGFKKAAGIKVGDFIAGSNEYVKVLSIARTGLKKSYKIKTKNGNEILVSAEHRIPTDGGLKSINSGLKVGDKVRTFGCGPIHKEKRN